MPFHFVAMVKRDFRRSQTIEYLQGEETQRLNLLNRYFSLQNG
jgi:hypothetical protein